MRQVLAHSLERLLLHFSFFVSCSYLSHEYKGFCCCLSSHGSNSLWEVFSQLGRQLAGIHSVKKSKDYSGNSKTLLLQLTPCLNTLEFGHIHGQFATSKRENMQTSFLEKGGWLLHDALFQMCCQMQSQKFCPVPHLRSVQDPFFNPTGESGVSGCLINMMTELQKIIAQKLYQPDSFSPLYGPFYN